MDLKMSQPYPQGFPGQPQPQYQPPQPQYAPQPQYQPQPQYGYQPQPQYAPPAQPAVPLAEGSLDEFFSQPSTGGGPAVSWKDRPDGYRVVGIVSRAIGKGDVLHQTDPTTKQPKYYRDGRPMFVMVVPLTVEPSPDFPEGEAKLFVRGQLRDELTRAMMEKGAPPNSAPEKDAGIVVTLVGRKPGRGMPSNVFAVEYFPPNDPATNPQDHAQQPAQQAQAQPQQPAQGQYVQQPQQGQQVQQQPQGGYVVQTGPVQQQANPQQQQQQQQPQPPANLNPDQQALLGKLTGGSN